MQAPHEAPPRCVIGATYKLRAFIVNTLLASVVVPVSVRVSVLRAFGVHIGDGTQIRPRCFLANTDIANLANISIGQHAFINSKCFFECQDTITIGARVSLAMDVLLCTAGHDIGSADERAGDSFRAPIVIGDGCWLGARATVLAGVSIGRGCVIAAGALVTANCEPNGLYAGVPAKRVRDLV
jgi:maltose O-acetyltransferase